MNINKSKSGKGKQSLLHPAFWVFKTKKAARVLSGSFWFIPGVLILISLFTAFYLPVVSDFKIDAFLTDHRLGVATASSAMQVVQIIASTTITITSIAFSMTIVALVMASSQFGPRLLKNFMQNKSTQWVLGTFTATFVFCLVVLNQINADQEVPYYPATSVFIAVILALICVFLLIFFIHHVATSIRADTVVTHTSNALMRDMRTLQKKNSRMARYSSVVDSKQYPYQTQLRSNCSGYIQAIEYKHVIDIACNHKGLLKMHHRAGQFIIPNTPIATLYSTTAIAETIDIDEALVTGNERTSLQDPLFAINQLVEMALRALSPSLNDPFTATNCIDGLAEAMGSFTLDTLPHNVFLDNDNNARVLSNEVSFDDLFKSAFLQIRQSCEAHPFVLIHLLKSFELMLDAGDDKHLLKAIATQVSAIKQNVDAKEPFISAVDKQAYQDAMGRLESKVSPYFFP